MNHSIYTADRSTHLRIVVATLLASIAMMATMLGTKLAHLDANGRSMATQTVYKQRPNHNFIEMARIEKRPI
ncbi:hypothetical protein [Bradyrhizobium sp. Gha]|uniref:hypothetical protein n=1 Tax=Bradyrhizobium sp. Gha TaxID=1855318 RepID=UPI001160C6A5|nr:hypothetical protein [Bradyrhizobium sp. Gha]